MAQTIGLKAPGSVFSAYSSMEAAPGDRIGSYPSISIRKLSPRCSREENSRCYPTIPGWAVILC
ncbi:hypothetical protein BT67DRAFT_49272 [Trichocladium antarcticum]|uniref:Uncharacterized protein n=1 Tax=Trichocladium antarcticum TaxID=1450529 RepID=A0AAN6ZDF5_9PEZI|nr:hypothetical protein BT67DRAFT_49272 [Trichocladium antarcticum]